MAWIIWLVCICWAGCLVLVKFYVWELKNTIKSQNEEIALLRLENIDLKDNFELLRLENIDLNDKFELL